MKRERVVKTTTDTNWATTWITSHFLPWAMNFHVCSECFSLIFSHTLNFSHIQKKISWRKKRKMPHSMRGGGEWEKEGEWGEKFSWIIQKCNFRVCRIFWLPPNLLKFIFFIINQLKREEFKLTRAFRHCSVIFFYQNTTHKRLLHAIISWKK